MILLRFVCLLAFLLWGGVANAAATNALDDPELNAAFSDMLRQPTDRAVALRYSGIAMELGDYEAAIPPLERMLMLRSDQPDLRMLLGECYFRLQSYEMAKSYLGEVATSTSAPVEMKQEATRYLDDIKWKAY